MKPTAIYAARRYLAAIRNTDKREYGVRYFAYLRGAAHDPEPVNISTMAAQAVRMRLEEIIAA